MLFFYTDKSWNTLEWVAKRYLTGQREKKIATTQDHNGFTINALVDDDSKRIWKEKAPFSFKLFDF